MNPSHLLLTVDIGNTSIGLALFSGNTIVIRNKMETPADYSAFTISELIPDTFRRGVTEAIVSSVVPRLDQAVREVVSGFIGKQPQMVDHLSDSGLDLKIKRPEELGADRIAAMSGALALCDPPLMVLDSGTAITFDLVDKDMAYIGGAIFPGIDISIKGLAHFAAKLEPVPFKIPDSAVGVDTESSINAGLFHCYVGGLNHMISLYQKILGPDSRVIVTGGLIRDFKNHLAGVDHHEPDLIFHGLRRIFERNRTG